MRLLHSSDWHLGQFFIGQSRAAEHQAFFAWLRQQIMAHQVDVLLVAGDIFDTSTPPSYARELYHQLIVDLQPSGVQIILLGGNHDSVAVLQESASLLQCLHTHVIPGLSPDLQQHLVPIYTNDATASNGKKLSAIIAAMPYLRPRDLSLRDDGKRDAGASIQDKQQQLQQQISTVYHDIYQAAHTMAAQLAPGEHIPIIGTGHFTTVGASRSESERDLYIGTLAAFPAQALPPFCYMALGHIHQPQKVAQSEHIRYCGSPIALSFSEVNQQKQVLLVDITTPRLPESDTPNEHRPEPDQPNSSSVQVTPLPVPCFQPLASIRSSLAQLPDQLAPHLAGLTTDQQLWLELIVTGEDALLMDLNTPLQSLLAELPVQLLKIRRERASQASDIDKSQVVNLTELTPADVIAQRLGYEDLTDATRQRLLELHQIAWQQVLTDAEQQQAVAETSHLDSPHPDHHHSASSVASAEQSA